MRLLPRLVLAAALASLPLASLRAQEVTPQMQALYEKAHGEQADHPEAAVADYRALLKLAPQLGPAYNNLGRLLFNLGRFPEAAEVLRQGLAVQPGMHPAEAMLGASLLRMGDPAGAVEPLRAASIAMPEDHFVRLTLAQALVAAHQPEAAVPELERLTHDDPKDQESWYLLGKMQLELSRLSFAHVQQIDPNSVVAHDLAGEIMESMNNLPGAIDEYKKAMARTPNDLQPLEHLANVYYQAGDWDNARRQLGALLEREPTNCTAHWKLSKALNELAAPPPAVLHEAGLAVTECPRLAPAYLEEARALLRTERAAEAIPALKTAEAITPDEPAIQALLARAYRAHGEPAQAAQANARFNALQKAEHTATEAHAAEVLGANQ